MQVVTAAQLPQKANAVLGKGGWPAQQHMCPLCRQLQETLELLDRELPTAGELMAALGMAQDMVDREPLGVCGNPFSCGWGALVEVR